MKTCNECSSILPNHYTVCPECRSYDLSSYKMTDDVIREEKEEAIISAFVECGELKGEEL